MQPEGPVPTEKLERTDEDAALVEAGDTSHGWIADGARRKTSDVVGTRILAGHGDRAPRREETSTQ